MITQTEQKPLSQMPLTTEEDFRKKISKDVLDILPDNFFQQLNSEPRGQIVIAPDLNKLFNTILLSVPKTEEQKNKILERYISEGMKLWAVKFPSEKEGGGVLSYLTTHDLPYRGVPHIDAVERLGSVKRIITTMIKSLPVKPLIVYYAFIFLISRKMFHEKINSIFKNFLDYANNSLSPFKLEEIRYCRYVQEIRRTINEMVVKRNLSVNDNSFVEQFKDVLSILFEDDNAYRYRSQDFWHIANIKILAFGSRKRFLKEINRIFEEVKKRENVRWEKVKNLQKKKVLILFFFRIKKYRDLFQEFCQLVDYKKLLFTPEDRDFINRRSDYMFEGNLLTKMKPMWEGYVKMYEKELETSKKEQEIKFAKMNIDILKKHLEMYAN